MIPALPGVDSTLALLRGGYPFIGRSCDELGVDAFRTRLLGRGVVCARGADAARTFYRTGRFTRRGAMPHSAVALLQDVGSVQALDGAAHRHRRSLFRSTVPQTDAREVVERFDAQWWAAVDTWPAEGRIVLQHEIDAVLTRTATDWLGLSIPDGAMAPLTETLSGMVRFAGSVGPRHWRARRARTRCETWLERRVQRLRDEPAEAQDDSPFATFVGFRDEHGQLLPARIVAIELLNVLRPVVAVGRFIVFAALALARHPEWRARLAAGDDGDLLPFVHEVRRFYPFFPVIGGPPCSRSTGRGTRSASATG